MIGSKQGAVVTVQGVQLGLQQLIGFELKGIGDVSKLAVVHPKGLSQPQFADQFGITGNLSEKSLFEEIVKRARYCAGS